MAENGEVRMDRIERAMEAMVRSQAHLLQAQENLVAEHRRLLTAQVVLTERVQKLADTVGQQSEQMHAGFAELRASQALTDERFRSLIDTLRNPAKN